MGVPLRETDDGDDILITLIRAAAIVAFLVAVIFGSALQ